MLFLLFLAEESNEPVKGRPRLQLQPRTKPIENVPSDSPSSADQTSPNVDNLDGSSHNEADAESGVALTANTSARRAGASIFGGAKPVDTTARELEIEKKIRDLQVTNEEQEEEKVETTKYIFVLENYSFEFVLFFTDQKKIVKFIVQNVRITIIVNRKIEFHIRKK